MSAHSITSRGLAGRKIPQGTLTPIGTLLFAASEPGAWYDPSDLSTLFQDAAGATPVTAVEQPVGRMLDKSGNGNHASQATTTKRGVVSRRVNLHTASEFPAGIADAPTSSGVTAGSIAGYQGAIAFDAGADRYAFKNNYTVLAGIEYVFSVVVQMTDGLAPNFDTSGTPGNDLELFIGTAGAGPVDPRTYSVANLGSGTYRVTCRKVVNANSPNVGVWKKVTDSSRAFKVTAYDLRLAIDAHLPYQSVNTATDYDADPNKFPTYIRFDGVDDAYQTNSIDFTGTDKMTVWAGVTKLSDAAVAVVTELGNSLPPGGFYVAAPNSVGPTFGFASKGTIPASQSPSGHAAPISRVVTGIGDIGADIATCRVNGVNTTINSDQGTGNYGNYPLYIGARAGTSLFFNGRLYQLIVRGAQSSLSQLEAGELLTKSRMKLP